MLKLFHKQINGREKCNSILLCKVKFLRLTSYGKLLIKSRIIPNLIKDRTCNLIDYYLFTR